jgi:hypothetical protein
MSACWRRSTHLTALLRGCIAARIRSSSEATGTMSACWRRSTHLTALLRGCIAARIRSQ